MEHTKLFYLDLSCLGLFYAFQKIVVCVFAIWLLISLLKLDTILLLGQYTGALKKNQFPHL